MQDDAGLLEEVIVSYKTAGLTGMIDSAFKKMMTNIFRFTINKIKSNYLAPTNFQFILF